MVRLDNPYSFYRPRAAHYFLMLVIFLLASVLKKFSPFSFVYQFTIPIALTLFMAYFFDTNILSKKSILGGEFAELGRIYFYIAPIIFAISFKALKTIFSLQPHYFLHFSANGRIPLLELVILLMVITIPVTEILFRGFFQLLCTHLFGKKLGIIINVVLYVLFFLALTNNVMVIFYSALMGSLFSYIAHRESSILPSIIAHEIMALFLFILKF